ncbi:hypothetical protein D3C87_1905470 [compost metagenome]
MDGLSGLPCPLLGRIRAEEQPLLGDGLAVLGKPALVTEVAPQQAEGLRPDEVHGALSVALADDGQFLGCEPDALKADGEGFGDPDPGVGHELEDQAVAPVGDGG